MRGPAASPLAGGTPASLFAAAVAQHQAGAFAEAERRYRYILSLYPDHADSLHNLGLLALQSGNAASAAELIGKAIKLNNRVGEYHYNIALAWRGLNRMDQVATHLQRAIELRPDHALAHLNLGNVRREQGRLADAVACYERGLALNPNFAAARINLANVLAEQGRWEAAVAAYRQALALEPNHAEAHHRLGKALMALGKVGEAIAHFEATVALRPDLTAGYEGLSAASLTVGKLDVAVHAIARGLELNEKPEAKTLFAQCVRVGAVHRTGRSAAQNGVACAVGRLGAPARARRRLHQSHQARPDRNRLHRAGDRGVAATPVRGASVRRFGAGGTRQR